MGRSFAERLLDGGHDVTIWNRTPHKADDLVARGAREAATPAEAADMPTPYLPRSRRPVHGAKGRKKGHRASESGPAGIAAREGSRGFASRPAP